MDAMTPLTDEQKQFAEQNHNIIFKFMHDHGLPIWTSDEKTGTDWYGVCSIGYLKAVATFAKKKGVSFSSYAYKCMLREIQIEFRSMKSQKRKVNFSPVSLNVPISKKDAEESVILMDVIRDDASSYEDTVIFFTDLQASLLHMDVLEQKVIRMLAGGYSVKEVMEEMKISPQKMRAIKKKFSRLQK